MKSRSIRVGGGRAVSVFGLLSALARTGTAGALVLPPMPASQPFKRDSQARLPAYETDATFAGLTWTDERDVSPFLNLFSCRVTSSVPTTVPGATLKNIKEACLRKKNTYVRYQRN